MGKTKTQFVEGSSDIKSGEEKYKEKQKKKAEKESEKVHIAGLKGGQRVVAISAEPTDSETEAEKKTKDASKGPKVRSKKYKDAKAKVTQDKFYAIIDAIKLLKDTSFSKFDGTCEIHMVVKKEGISANYELPYSGGKQKKVEVADEATLEKLKSGKIDFDVLLATADMMPKLVPFARLLGPKGMMPNPKNGTLIKDKKDAGKFSGNRVMVKTEKGAPLIHTTFGKVSQKEEELIKNCETILDAINRKVIDRAYVKATMGPAIKLKVS